MASFFKHYEDMPNKLTHKEESMREAGIPAVLKYRDKKIELEEFWHSKIKILGGKGHYRFNFEPYVGQTLTIYDLNSKFTIAQIRNVLFETID